MEWLQILSLFLANAGLILWMRAESRADFRQLNEEMKDFHGRLCKLEERFVNWLMTKGK